MSQTDRVHTTPLAIHDAIETKIPYKYRSQTVMIFADLKSNNVAARENAIIQGHAVASQLKAIAEGQNAPGLYTDAEPSACLKVATFLYAAMDAARQSAPSHYPSGAVNDVASVTDSAAAYAAMIERDRTAWRNPDAQTRSGQVTDD